jgi:hypothetical protein
MNTLLILKYILLSHIYELRDTGYQKRILTSGRLLGEIPIAHASNQLGRTILELKATTGDAVLAVGRETREGSGDIVHSFIPFGDHIYVLIRTREGNYIVVDSLPLLNRINDTARAAFRAETERIEREGIAERERLQHEETARRAREAREAAAREAEQARQARQAQQPTPVVVTTEATGDVFSAMETLYANTNPVPIRLEQTLRVRHESSLEFLRTFLTVWNNEKNTIFVADRRVQTEAGKRRSLYDIYGIMKYYYPEITLRVLIQNLKTLLNEPHVRSSICRQLNKRVFYYDPAQENGIMNGNEREVALNNLTFINVTTLL